MTLLASFAANLFGSALRMVKNQTVQCAALLLAMCCLLLACSDTASRGSSPGPSGNPDAECPVDHAHISSLTPDTFEKEYRKANKPLLITGVLESSDAWAPLQDGKSFLKTVRKAHTSTTVDLFSRSFASLRSGYRNFQLPLREVVDENGNWVQDSDLYIFDNFFEGKEKLLGGLRKASKVGAFHKGGMRWVLGMGPAGGSAGAGLHSHGEAWLALLPNGSASGGSGKVWYFWDNQNNVPSAVLAILHMQMDASTADVHMKNIEKQTQSGMTRCMQRPGEVLYLPGGFPHATLNVGHGLLVGIGAQFEKHEQRPDETFKSDFALVSEYRAHADQDLEKEQLLELDVWDEMMRLRSIQPFLFLTNSILLARSAPNQKRARGFVKSLTDVGQQQGVLSQSLKIESLTEPHPTCRYLRAETLNAAADVEYMVFQNKKKAIGLLEQSAALCNRTKSMLYLAQMHGEAGDYASALKWAKKRAEVFPADKETRELISAAKTMVGRGGKGMDRDEF